MISRIINNLFKKIIIRIGTAIHQSEKQIASRTLPRFKNQPKNLTIAFPRRIVNAHHISIGDNVYIGPGSMLMSVDTYIGVVPPENEKINIRQTFTPELIIGSRVTATGSLQISALRNITIEDDVMFASNIFICDGFHGYKNAYIPYRYQEMESISPILIRRGCWIGQNVVIMPGVTIGEMCIIGANSVVTKPIPDRCLAVGAPARVIKQWNSQTREWITMT